MTLYIICLLICIIVLSTGIVDQVISYGSFIVSFVGNGKVDEKVHDALYGLENMNKLFELFGQTTMIQYFWILA